MSASIPLLPFPYKLARVLIRGFYPLSDVVLKFFPSLDRDLEESGNRLSGREYMGGALLTFTFYFLLMAAVLIFFTVRSGRFDDLSTRQLIVIFSLVISSATFIYILMFPRLLVSKKRDDIEKNLLFASRQLMVQTSAGVPLFDAIVSLSEKYDDPKFNYGMLSDEFKRIVKQVKSGRDFSSALEESAMHNPSPYYQRIMWQISNATKSGSEISGVLKTIVAFLSEEQRIMIKNYGSQLNPLAMFYMFTCVVAPTMGLIFLLIISTSVSIPVNAGTLSIILVFLLVMQVLFIGLIKSRRPKVAL